MADGYDRFENEGGGCGSFVMGLLTGTVLGAGLGMLFAPKSGSETRDFLMSKANEGTELAKRRAQELKDQAAVTIERGKSTVQRQKESLSAAVDAGRAAYRDTVNQPLPE